MNQDGRKRNKSGGKQEGAGPVLGLRALNRALLARQLLLQRTAKPALEVIEQLAGLQAQAPGAPYFALWARIEGFRQEELSGLILNKEAVRIALMRSTLHLVSGRDCRQLRPWLQPALERGLSGAFGRRLAGIDTDALAAAGRALVEAEPLTFSEMGRQLGGQWPDYEPDALAAAVRTWVPLIQVPPRGLWGESGQARHTSAEAWLGPSPAVLPQPEEMVLRYLAAYGPASVQDIQVWSGLTRLNRVVEELRPRLFTFRDEQGRELFDLPDAPRPDADTLCPPRFLGEFDNILLSHADRSRMMEESYRKRVFTVNGIIRSTILLDGFVSGLWRLQRERSHASLVIEPFRPLSGVERDGLAAEGEQLLRFAEAGAASTEVIFVPASG